MAAHFPQIQIVRLGAQDPQSERLVFHKMQPSPGGGGQSEQVGSVGRASPCPDSLSKSRGEDGASQASGRRNSILHGRGLPVWSYRPCPLGSTALKLVVLSLPDQSETALGAPSSSQSPIHPSQREVPSSWAEGKSRG